MSLYRMGQMMHRAAQRRENDKAIRALLLASARRQAEQLRASHALSITFERFDWIDALLCAACALCAFATLASMVRL